MKKYIIDGNNLLGKMREAGLLPSAPPDFDYRETTARFVADYFTYTKAEVLLFFDGFEKLPIRFGKMHIRYSDNRTADDLIRDTIEFAKNRKLLVLVSSDNELRNFARACSCEIIAAEAFIRSAKPAQGGTTETKRISELEKEQEYFRQLFENTGKREREK